MNMTKILLAAPVCDAKKKELIPRVASLRAKGITPKLIVVLIGEDPASKVYVAQKSKRAIECGVLSETVCFSANISPEFLRQRLTEWNDDPRVHGVLIQRPLPAQFQESLIQEWICPHKDVDCFHPENLGKLALGYPRFVSCTPQGVLDLLRYYDLPVKGKNVLVVGRSKIVGKPLAYLLTNENATVTIAHTSTLGLTDWIKKSEIIIFAAGQAKGFPSAVFAKNSIIIDVGIHRLPDGLVGDVDWDHSSEFSNKILAYSPVPGGVGPLTIMNLLSNVVLAAEMASANPTS